jgi:tetratricopeptide (TPR) repeat protein
VSRLADMLMAMDDKRARRPGLGGIPRLGESAEPRRQWRIAGILVMVIIMGIVAVALVLRPQTLARSSASAGVTTPDSTPAVASPAPPRRAVPVADRVAALMRAGIEAGQSGELDQAVAAFRKAVELDPTDALAWDSLGVVLIRAGDEARGVEAFRRALRAVPGHAEAHRNLAVVLDRQGRGAEAARHYRAFLAKSPADSPDRAPIMARLEAMGARRGVE